MSMPARKHQRTSEERRVTVAASGSSLAVSWLYQAGSGAEINRTQPRTPVLSCLSRCRQAHTGTRLWVRTAKAVFFYDPNLMGYQIPAPRGVGESPVSRSTQSAASSASPRLLSRERESSLLRSQLVVDQLCRQKAMQRRTRKQQRFCQWLLRSFPTQREGCLAQIIAAFHFGRVRSQETAAIGVPQPLVCVCPLTAGDREGSRRNRPPPRHEGHRLKALGVEEAPLQACRPSPPAAWATRATLPGCSRTSGRRC